MLEPPRQDWQSYEEGCRAARVALLRSLTPAGAMAIYEEFHVLVSRQTADEAGVARLGALRRAEKLAARRRMRSAFAELDRIRREGRNSDDAG